MRKRLFVLVIISLVSLGLVSIALAAAGSATITADKFAPKIVYTTQRSEPAPIEPSSTYHFIDHADQPRAPTGESAWDSYWVGAPTVISDSGQLRMWYTGWGPVEAGIGEASSADGISWTRSPLNPVLTPGLEAAVFKEGPADYKMWFGGNDFLSIYRATSSDGLAWTVDPAPAFEASSVDGTFDRDSVEDAFVIMDGGGTYRLFYTGGNTDTGVYQIGTATSPDGLAWTRVATPVLPPGDPGDWDEIHTMDPMVILDGGTFKMWYSAFDSSNARRIGYATSSNGVDWTKYASNPVFEPDPGQWDDGSVGNHAVVFNGDYHMWYTSNGRIGYVTSTDGIDWTRFLAAPVLEPGSSLYAEVNYAHDWVNAGTDPFEPVVITYTGAGGSIATVSGQADEGGWFSSDYGSWDPGRPNIAPGDMVVVAAAGLTAAIDPIGSIEGALDVDENTIVGSIHAPWFSPTPLIVRCEVWIENGPPGIEIPDIDADGGSYSCDFDDVGWDLQPGQTVAVRYVEPDGDTVINIFETPTLRVNYAHDWVEGSYEAGHTIWITLTNATGEVKATASGVSGPIPWWGDQSGFSTDYNLAWTPSRPDLQELDWVYAAFDDGFASSVRIGQITGDPDVNADTISGTITAPWFTEPLQGDCGVWIENGPGTGFQEPVDPNGGSYFCDFGALFWDLVPGQDVGVGYREPDGDQVYNVFREPAPELRVWIWGQGRPASGGNMALWVGYQNNGNAPDEGAYISATLEGGLTYLSDTSGLPHSGDGTPGNPLVWQLPAPLQPSMFQTRFEVFVHVDAAEGEMVEGDAYIGSDMPYYQGDQGAKYSHWEDQVVAFTPDLSVNKWAWTGDPVPGSTYVYAVTVCNFNENAAGSLPVILTDTLPVSVTLQSWWAGHGGWEEVSSSDHELVVSRPSVPGGWCGDVFLRVLLDENAWPGMSLFNTADVATSGDTSPGNNTITIENGVGTPRDNLWVSKDWVNGQFVPGGEIYYSFNFGNGGNLPVENVLVTSTLPENTTFVRAWTWTPYGEVDYPPDVITSDHLVWDAGVLENGFNRNVNLTLRIDDDAPVGSLLTHTVDINRLPLEDRYDDNRITWVDPLNDYGPNLWVNKQNYNWEWEGRLWYEIRVANRGNTWLDDFWITDTYPVSTTLTDWWVNHGPWITATEDVGNRQIAFWVDGLNPGETASIGFHLDLDGDIIGQEGLLFPNQVDAPLEGDVYPADNHDQVTARTGPDVYIEKQLSGGVPEPGELVTYTVSFGNANLWPWDGDPNYGSHITDTLPEGMTFITATWAGGYPWVPELVDGNTVVWQAGTMWNNSHWEFDLVVQLDEGLQGGDVLTNTIEMYGDSPDDIEPNWENNVFELPLTVLAPVFEVGKTFESSLVAGMPVRYDLSLANVGNQTATGIALVDVIPEGVTFGGSDGGYSAGRVTWEIASLAPGGSAAGWFTGTLTCEAGVEVVNEEYNVASSDQGVTTPDGSPVSFTTLAPEIQVSFQASETNVGVGQSVSFTAEAATDGTPLSYAWDFGDSETGSGTQVEHAFAAPGSYPVELVVTDGCGFTSSYSLTVVVEPQGVYLPLVLNLHNTAP